MKRLKALAAVLALALVSMVAQQGTAATLNQMDIGTTPSLSGTGFEVEISGGAFESFFGTPQALTYSGGALAGNQSVAFNSISGELSVLSFVSPLAPLLTGDVLDSGVNGNVATILFGSVGGTLGSEFGSFFVAQFTGVNDFADGANPGAALDILPAAVIPLPLGVVTLGSALGLLAVARRRRAA